MTQAILPSARVAIAGGALPSREWYAYFQALKFNLDQGDDALQQEIDALDVRVKALEDAPASGGSTRITGVGSIYVSATAIKVISLQGDSDDPGLTTYYGTDATGEKGWYPVADTLADSGNILKTTDADGVTSFDLADLADSGTGAALLKITRDAKGRVSGSEAANLDDLADVDTAGVADGNALVYDAGTSKWVPGVGGSGSGGVLPVVTGEVPPVFVYLDDGSLVYAEVA